MAEGEIGGGMYLLEVKYTYSVGGSIGAAHGGLNGGIYRNSSTNMLTFELSEQVSAPHFSLKYFNESSEISEYLTLKYHNLYLSHCSHALL